MPLRATKTHLQHSKGPQNNQNTATAQAKKTMDRVQFWGQGGLRSNFYSTLFNLRQLLISETTTCWLVLKLLATF